MLVPATTGDQGEYTALKSRNVSADVSSAITMWLARQFSAAK